MATSKPILLKSIYNAIESLGACASASRRLPKKLREAPSFIAEYQVNIEWSKRKEYHSSQLLYDEIELKCISLGGNVEAMPDEYEVPGTEDMKVYAIGTEGDGNYILFLDGNDAKPRNPTVYRLDHEMQSEPDVICDLLKFIKSLTLSP